MNGLPPALRPLSYLMRQNARCADKEAVRALVDEWSAATGWYAGHARGWWSCTRRGRCPPRSDSKALPQRLRGEPGVVQARGIQPRSIRRAPADGSPRYPPPAPADVASAMIEAIGVVQLLRGRA